MSDAPYSALAVDPSMTETGWAHWLKGERAPSGGMFPLPSWGDEEGKFANKWRKWLTDLCWDRQVTVIFIEDNSFALDHHETTTQKLATIGLMLNALQVADQLHIDAQLVTPQQWRGRFWGTERPPKNFTKSARRTWLKEKSIASCNARGWMIDNNNIADAHGILDFGLCCIDPVYDSRSGPLFRRAQLQAENEERNMR